MTIFNIERAKNSDELALLACQVISKQISSILSEKDRFQLALSGGSTPSKLYSILGRENLPWERVDVFLGDERWVSHTDQQSNALMLKRTLFSSIPGSKASFYPVPTTELNHPEESAEEFSKILTNVCNGIPPVFDLILLGLGEDGHTASLFPGTDSLTAKDVFTTVCRGKAQDRISLTADVLSSAKQIIFLVSGESKQIALKRLLDPEESYQRTPAKLVKPMSEILILTDEIAAALI